MVLSYRCNESMPPIYHYTIYKIFTVQCIVYSVQCTVYNAYIVNVYIIKLYTCARIRIVHCICTVYYTVYIQ